MNYTSKLLKAALAVLSLSFAAIGHAQTLGDRYVAADFTVLDLDLAGINPAYGFDVAYNEPVTKNLDLRASYAYSHLSDSGIHATQHDALVSAVGYLTKDKISPFLSVSAGWIWVSGNGYGYGVSDDSFVYGGGGGIQVKFTDAFAVSASANYIHVDKANDGDWAYTVAATYALNQSWVLRAGVTFDDESDFLYAAGVGFRF